MFYISEILLKAKYDEELEEWKFSSSSISNEDSSNNKRPVSHPLRRRPISEYALLQAKTNSNDAVRYKNENIVSYELEMPCRTTQEYRSPKVSASLQAVLAQAMQTGDDIDIGDSQTNSIRTRLENIINANAASAVAQNAAINGGGATTPTAGGIKSVRSGIPGSAMDSNRRPPTGRTALKKPTSAYPKARGLVNK